jgi:hypothetical protein
MKNDDSFSSDFPEHDKRLSIEHCRKVLNKDGHTYTDEQVKQIRDLLYTFAHIEKEANERKRTKEGNS